MVKNDTGKTFKLSRLEEFIKKKMERMKKWKERKKAIEKGVRKVLKEGVSKEERMKKEIIGIGHARVGGGRRGSIPVPLEKVKKREKSRSLDS